MNLVARDASPADYPDFARLFAELRVPDPTPTPEQFEARILPGAFMLRDGVRALGYVFWQRLGQVARVSHVVVEPAARRRGVGTALLRELAARAKRAGCSRWILNVKPDNVPAIRLYERFGLRTVARPFAMRIAWSDVPRLPLEDGTTAFVVAPEDEARVEGATGVLLGQIGVLRNRGGHVFLALRRDESVVALAAFDPSLSHAQPFATARPELARPLLEAMRPHSLPAHAFVRFVSEDSAVVGAAREAGAETVLEMLGMAGSLAET